MLKINLIIIPLMYSCGCFASNCGVSMQQSKDSCAEATKIHETIVGFIEEGNDKIYDDDFIACFSAINAKHGDCYYPGNNNEVRLYFFLADSVLLNKVKNDEKAMKLLIELYLVNFNNVELSEYYGFIVLPKAASININSFIKVLSFKTEKEADRCISRLEYIDDISEIERIKSNIANINNPEFIEIVRKIRNRLP